MQAIEDGGDTQNFSSNLVGNVILSTDSPASAYQTQCTEMLRSWHTHGTYLSITAFYYFSTSASAFIDRRKPKACCYFGGCGPSELWKLVENLSLCKVFLCRSLAVITRLFYHSIDGLIIPICGRLAWNCAADSGKISVLIVISRPSSARDV